MANVDDYIIDFSKEETGGGGGIRIKEGTYNAKIISAKPVKSGDKGTPGLELKLKILDGPKSAKGKVITDTLWATPKAYSRFRTLLEAAGKKVPAKVNLVKIAKAVKGIELYIEVQDEDDKNGKYKTRSRVTFEGYIHPDNVDEDDDDDEDEDDDDDLDEDDDDVEDDDEDEDDEDEDEDDDDEEDYSEMSVAELRNLAKERGLKVTAANRKSKAKLTALLEADDESDDEDDDDEDDDEPEEKPARRAAKGKASAKGRKSSKKKKASDDDDLDDIDLEDF